MTFLGFGAACDDAELPLQRHDAGGSAAAITPGGAQLAPLVSQDSEDVRALELSRPPRTPRLARMTFA